jgi:CDP-paratose 2-epimerase
MRVLITGACGFVGSRLAHELKNRWTTVELLGIDNLSRRGSETNIPLLRRLGCKFVHGDVRNPEDLAELPGCDWIVDCAANPSVLAGVTGGASQLVSHNLGGTLNLLEKCRRDSAGLLILSSSRVYSIDQLNAIPLAETSGRFSIDASRIPPHGCSHHGISESFSTASPVSLYGASKLASEIMALEYGAAFDFPVWVNRCGVIAGPGQFGRIDQGIFSFWIYQWLLGRPLSYIGYGGRGAQVRDLISPSDLAALVEKQLGSPISSAPRVMNVGGGHARSMSLRELSAFCREHLGENAHPIASEPLERRYDIPYYVTDARLAESTWDWRPQEPIGRTLEAIARWGVEHRSMLEGFQS